MQLVVDVLAEFFLVETDQTQQENSHPGILESEYTTYIAPNADANGNYTVIQHDSRTSGISLFKWDGKTLNADGTASPITGQGKLLMDLSQVGTDISSIGDFNFRNFGTGSDGKPLYILASSEGTLNGMFPFKIYQIKNVTITPAQQALFDAQKLTGSVDQFTFQIRSGLAGFRTYINSLTSQPPV